MVHTSPINTKKHSYVANSILHSEKFEDRRVNARYGILPQVKSLQTRQL